MCKGLHNSLNSLSHLSFHPEQNVAYGPLVKLVGQGYVDAPAQGNSVSISNNGEIVAVGGPSDSFRRGAAWVFNYDSKSSAGFNDAPRIVYDPDNIKGEQGRPLYVYLITRYSYLH